MKDQLPFQHATTRTTKRTRPSAPWPAFGVITLIIGLVSLGTPSSRGCDEYCDGVLHNVGFGDSALGSLTTGSDDTAVGLAALTSCTTGSDNTAVGDWALEYYQTRYCQHSRRFPSPARL